MTKLFDERKDAIHALRRWERVWEKERVFAAAWRCYAIARNWNLPIPDSVLAEFDRIARAFESEIADVRDAMAANASSSGTLAAKKAGEIVTQLSGRGSTNPALSIVIIERDLEIASQVAILRHNGEPENVAVEHVAAGTDVTPAMSPAAVRGAVQRARRFWPEAEG